MNTDLSKLRRWLAIGTGIGIEAGLEDLRVTVARVRPSGVAVLGAAAIAGYRNRPAADWGAIYHDFLKRAGGSHLPATVLLPRSELIVRQLALPGVPDRDLGAAIDLQIDSLHPYPEGEAAYSWARLASGSVLVAIVRRDVLDRYITLFSEAGIKVSMFSFSAAALFSALRLLSPPPGGGFLGIWESAGGLEAYGESEARPVFSAAFDVSDGKAAALARAELRLGPETGAAPIEGLLPKPKSSPADYDFSRDALSYAAALAGAAPRLSLRLNLLPEEFRSSASRLRLAPTAALAAALVVTVAGLAAINPIEDRKYLGALEREIRKLEPRATEAGALDRAIERARARTRALDDFRRRSKADLDAVAELTRILPAPASLSSLELTRDTVSLNGGAEQAGGFLKLIDASPLFRNSEFTNYVKQGRMEVFRIRAAREGLPQ